MKLENIKNLNDVENYLDLVVPDWKKSRGKETYSTTDTEHAKDYEVLQVFKPGDTLGIPFAEFWKGYYKFSPLDYTGFFGHVVIKGKNTFSFIGPLSFAVDAILELI